jgi:hypothetical protein
VNEDLSKKSKKDILLEIKAQMTQNMRQERRAEMRAVNIDAMFSVKGETTETAVVEVTIRLIDWLIPVLNDFPRSQRFLLADKIEMLLLGVLENLIRAVYARRNRSGYLWEANSSVQVARSLLRIALMRGYVTQKRYTYAIKELLTIGKMTGGWINALSKKKAR